MPLSKTRAQLVDVARQLFAKMGVENTTMNDIALASKKGRRTLYTYFKSKEDIYLAVVESQLDILLDTMKRVADKHISPDEKMLEMIYTRLDVVKEVVYRNGTLRADFFTSSATSGRWRRHASGSTKKRCSSSRTCCARVWRRVSFR